MITVRTLLDTDELPNKYWPTANIRPCNNTTLVAVDEGKIIGLLWMAYGGPAALVGLYLCAEPKVAWKLCNEAKSLAKSIGCRAIMTFVNPSRLLSAFQRRGGIVVELGAHMVVFPVI